MKRFFVFLGVVLTTIGSAVRAQEVESTAPLQMSSWGDAKTAEVTDYIPDVSLDMRFGYGQNFAEGAGRFGGDGLYLDINGYISPHISYSLNQRIASTYYEDNSGFDGTNWLTLTYETESFAFTAGKDAILVGSFEYDAYDLDSYYSMNSTFYNMFDCWQWGVSAAWYATDTQELSFQIANSPLSYGDSNLFAYALAWRGEWDFYESYWTANLWQWGPKGYTKALNFGNRFYLGDFTIDLEYMTRADEVSDLFGRDFTFLAAPSYENEWLRAFAKFGWEGITGMLGGGPSSYENIFYGAGVEFFPLKENRGIRLHAAWSHNEEYIGGDFLSIGLTWKFDLTGAVKHILDKRNN
ncbi:MAG: hypothetical protein IJX11_02800 [Bacteroidales bacterium]|nr:hypothetical protein [Bacteroidales bacterium]